MKDQTLTAKLPWQVCLVRGAHCVQSHLEATKTKIYHHHTHDSLLIVGVMHTSITGTLHVHVRDFGESSCSILLQVLQTRTFHDESMFR